jgi:putative ATP-binding cassette transporter
MLLVVIYNLLAGPVVAIAGYVTGQLILHWRRWLTELFLEHTFHDRAFYRISSDANIDNPDQRVSEDLSTFAGFIVSFVMQVLQGVATGGAFIVVVWLISPMLVVVLVVCVAGGSLLTIAIGRPLVGMNFAQRRREADFRYALVGLRNNAEAIALYGGERREQGELLRRLHAAMTNFGLLIVRQRNLAFFTYTYDFLLPLVPFLLLAPSFFAGTLEFGKITQAAAAFISTPCSAGWAASTRRRNGRTCSPSASSSRSRSPDCWSIAPRMCSSTRPPARWTRAGKRHCTTGSRRLGSTS